MRNLYCNCKKDCVSIRALISMNKNTAKYSFPIWRECVSIWRQCFGSPGEYPHLLCGMGYGSGSLFFIFIVKRSHHLSHLSRHYSISFKMELNNIGSRAEEQRQWDWTRYKIGRFVNLKNSFGRRRCYEISPLQCCSDTAQFLLV